MRPSLPLLLLLSVLSLGAAGAPAEPEDAQPLVRLQGGTITRDDVEDYLRIIELWSGRPAGDSGMDILQQEELEAQRRKEAVEALVQRRLLYEEARRELLGGQADADVLDRVGAQSFQRLADRLGSRGAAVDRLTEAGLTVEEFKEMQVQDLLVAELVRRKVHEQVQVAPAQIRRYYQENKQEFRTPRTVVYRQILFPAFDGADQKQQRKRAEKVLRKLKAGRPFGELADRHSADSDDHPGGLHEVAVPEEQPEWTPPAVAGLKPGQTSGVREVAGGLAIVRLEEIRPAGLASFERVQGQIRQLLLRRARDEALHSYVARLKEESSIEYLPAAREMGLP